MDLPTCPACGQSVLDDDAEVCPFCGASMTGKAGSSSKPSPKPAQQAPPAPKPPPAPAAGANSSKPKQARRKPAAGKSESPVDIKELGLDSVLPTDAIQASPKQTKSRRFKVKCPMCDTVGYIPLNAAAREIRCPNKNCLSPVFKAPEIQRKETVSATKTKVKKNNSKLIMASVVGIMFLGVIIATAIFLKKDPEKPEAPEKPPVNVADQKTPNEKQEQVPEKVEKKVPQRNIVEDSVIINESINKFMPDYAKSLDRNRSMAYCRRLLAIACAISGKLEEASSELKNFDAVGGSSPYEKIFPLSEIAWQYLAEGQNEKAKEVAQEIIQLRDTIPGQGHTAIDSGTTLAATLMAMDQKQQAIDLMKKYNDPDLTGQSLALVRKSQFLKDYNFDLFLNARRTYDTRYPQWSTVAMNLAAHGLPEKAANWAQSAPNQLAIQECLCAIIDAECHLMLSQDQSVSPDQIGQRINQFNKIYHPILWARASINALQMKQKDLAGQFLDKASAALREFSHADEWKIPEKKQLATSQIQVEDDFLLHALAAFEIARAEYLSDNREDAWEYVRESLLFLNDFSPSPLQIKPLSDDLKRGRSSLQAEFKKLLNLESNSKAADAYGIYRDNVQLLESQAEIRFDQSYSFLSEAIFWGMETEVLIVVSERKEFDSTDIFMQIDQQAKRAGKEIKIPEQEKNKIKDTFRVSRIESQNAFDKGEVEKAIRIVDGRVNSERPWKTIQLLSFTAQTAREKKEKGFDLFVKIHDQVLREFTLRLYCANLGSQGFATEAFQFCKERRERLTPTERISGLLGTIEGILASPTEKKEVSQNET